VCDGCRQRGWRRWKGLKHAGLKEMQQPAGTHARGSRKQTKSSASRPASGPTTTRALCHSTPSSLHLSHAPRPSNKTAAATSGTETSMGTQHGTRDRLGQTSRSCATSACLWLRVTLLLPRSTGRVHIEQSRRQDGRTAASGSRVESSPRHISRRH
jgi:hypothetical protein